MKLYFVSLNVLEFLYYIYDLFPRYQLGIFDYTYQNKAFVSNTIYLYPIYYVQKLLSLLNAPSLQSVNGRTNTLHFIIGSVYASCFFIHSVIPPFNSRKYSPRKINEVVNMTMIDTNLMSLRTLFFNMTSMATLSLFWNLNFLLFWNILRSFENYCCHPFCLQQWPGYLSSLDEVFCNCSCFLSTT